MQLFQYVKLLYPEFEVSKTKVHLARWNGKDNPLDQYIESKFDEWQSYQTRKNFERKFVISLIQAGRSGRWLFAGLYISDGCNSYEKNGKTKYKYNLVKVSSTSEYEGRLYVYSAYKARNSYPEAKTLSEDLAIHEITPQKIGFNKFQSYKTINLTRNELGKIIENDLSSWKFALKSVKGIYVLTDTKTGRLYVGKADGQSGIWGRWCQYYDNGHGGNKGLKEEFNITNEERLNDIKFAILEVLDINSSEEDVYERESYWKEILASRITGYNLN